MKFKIKELPAYITLRVVTTALRFISYEKTQKLGRLLGNVAYYTSFKYFKRGMQSLSLAHELNLTESKMKEILKEAFQNLCITSLEVFKLSYSSDQEVDNLIVSHNSEIIRKLHNDKQSFIIFGAHQSNWELIFLDLSRQAHGPGVGIGKPLKNELIYSWLKSIRERFGGTIIPNKQALRGCIKTLKLGGYVAIVGDQGLPESPFSSNFLGTRAWTSTAPALLSYKTNSPIVPMTIYRREGKYHIYYHEPILPKAEVPLKEYCHTATEILLKLASDNIKKAPGEWLWMHKRWKQHSPYNVEKKYRYDFIGIIMPQNKDSFLKANKKLELLNKLYPRGFFWIHTPTDYQHLITLENCEVRPYSNSKDILIPDWRYQMVIDFTDSKKIRSHFLKYSTERVVSSKEFDNITKEA